MNKISVQNKRGMSREYSLVNPAFSNSYLSKSNIFQEWGPSKIYPPDTQLYQQNSPADNIYLLEGGLVILSWLESSSFKMILGLRYKNWLLGGPSVILGKPYACTASTLTRSYIKNIPAKTFLRQLEKDKRLSLYVNWILSYEIHGCLLAAIGFRNMQAKDRLKRFLCELILEEKELDLKKRSELQKPVKLNLPLKQHELAQIIAVTPEHLSRLIKKLEQQGIIKRVKENLIVNSPMSLLSEFNIL